MNNITVFKENNKLYIVMENPSQKVEEQIMNALDISAVSIAEILKPAKNMDTSKEAAKIEAAAPDAENGVVHTTTSPEVKKGVDVTAFSPDQAKRYLIRFLKALEKNPDTKFSPKKVLIAYFKVRNREDGVAQVSKMSEEQASSLWMEKAMLKNVIRVTEVDFKAPEGTGYDGWV